MAVQESAKTRRKEPAQKQKKEPVLARVQGLPAGRKTLFFAAVIFIVFAVVKLLIDCILMYSSAMLAYYITLIEIGEPEKIFIWGTIRRVIEFAEIAVCVFCIVGGAFGIRAALSGKAGACKVLACICAAFAVALFVLTILSAVFDAPIAKPDVASYVGVVVGLVLAGTFAWASFRVRV